MWLHRCGAIGTGLTAMLLALTPALAGADRYVSRGAVAGAPDRSCSTAAYATVQAAVNAASDGERVYLCGGVPFAGPVVIRKSLVLAGDPGAGISAVDSSSAADADQIPAGDLPAASTADLQPPDAVVAVLGDVDVQINGLAIRGPFDNQGCASDDYGVLALGSAEHPAQLMMSNDSVSAIGAADQTDFGGCQYGVDIQAGREYWPDLSGVDGGYLVENFAATANIQFTSVSTYQKNGITVDGPGSQAQLTAVTVNGGGQTSAITRNGIQISRGATGEIANTMVSGNEYTGTSSFAAATGILITGGCGDPLDTGVQVHNDTLTNDDVGISVSEFNPACNASTTTPTGERIHNNAIAKNDGVTDQSPFTDQAGDSYTGYQVGIADSGDGDIVVNNRITTAGAAFGPLVAPGGHFLAPIDVQSNPAVKPVVAGNSYNGAPTRPPYPATTS